MRTNLRVKAIVIKDGKLLLFHRFREGSEYYAFPGGGVEEGEDLDTALKREILEETGLNLISHERIFEQTENGRVFYFYRCELEEGEMILGGPEREKQSPANQYRFEWVDLSKLPGLAYHIRPDRLIEWLDRIREDRSAH